DIHRIREIYSYMYKGVYRTNLALEKIPSIDMDEDLKQRLLGEAKFLRGLYHFYVSTVYGYPPLIEFVPQDLNIQYENATREEFLTSITRDLREAAAVLPETYNDSNLGRATKGAAYGFLGRTFLYHQQWDSAKYYLQKVVELEDKGVYGLMQPQGNDPKDWIYAFQCNFSALDLTSPSGNTYDSENNMESIFEIQFHYGGWEVWEGGWQADGSITCLYFGPDGYKNLIPTAEYVSQFEEAPASHPAGLEYDPRRYATIYEEGDTITYLPELNRNPVAWNHRQHTNLGITEGYGWEKYFNPTHFSNNGPTNLKLMRYSEILLMLAEAEYHLNGSTELAVNSLNKVRERVGLDPVSEVTPEVIMHERDVEFGFEWHRFFDCVRWSLLPDPWVNCEELMEGFVRGKNEYLPIPQYEINLSGGTLKQNPGW
ncbi:MAG: RagB/SusD family nutrient uptake outer membrane protein, partial [Bacteroidales bacterium]